MITPLALLQGGAADAEALLFSLPAGVFIGSSLAYFTNRFRRYGTWKRWMAAGGVTGFLGGALAVDIGGEPIWVIPVAGMLGVIFTACVLAEWHR